MSRTKKKSGAEYARLRKKKLLETAGSASDQKRMVDCFKKNEDLEDSASIKIGEYMVIFLIG